MVVKERIVVDLMFNDINTCVTSVKEWFNSKGYKKITARNPDRWSTAVILDIAKGGLMSKTTIQTTFKSHAGGSSIMIEFVASNDGAGLSGKPVTSMAPDPKDKAYEALAMELSKYVRATWKRGGGPGLPPEQAPSTMYQTSTPSYSSPDLQQSQQQNYGGYQSQQYGTYQEQPQTGYEASGGYSQEQQQTYQQEYQQEQPQPVMETPAVPEAEPVAEPITPPPTETPMSDEEAARLEAELAQEEPVEPPVVRPGPEPEEEAPSGRQISIGSPNITPPVNEPETYSGPPPVMPEPEVPQPPQIEPPAPEPITPEPITPEPALEPKPEIAPVEAQPAPVVQPVAPTETFCPGCGKKTKPRWKTCPYCEKDLASTKPAEPAPVAAPVVEAPVQPQVEPAVEQPKPVVEQRTQTIGNVTATCPVCPTCGQAPTWIDDYKRYYCYTCQQYL
jgi:hypothetical protein